MEFKVNDYITLKLIGSITAIFIKNKRFQQCSRLMLNIPSKDIVEYDNINSIDEAVEVNKSLYNGSILPSVSLKDPEPSISPEQEFWGHCSNLQAWAENNYDTRLIHSNLSFPLLKKLYEAGDRTAKKHLNSEIVRRFSSGVPSVVEFLANGGYLDTLTPEELQTCADELKENMLPDLNKYRNTGLRGIGNAFMALEDYEEALRIHEKICESEDFKTDISEMSNAAKNKILIDIGISYYYRRDYTNALKFYKKAATYVPKDAVTLYNISEIYAKKGNYKESIRLAKKALLLNSAIGSGHILIGDALTHFKKYSQAISEYQQAIEKMKHKNLSTNQSIGKTFYKIAYTYYLKEDRQKSIEFCKKCLKQRPNYTKALELKEKLKY